MSIILVTVLFCLNLCIDFSSAINFGGFGGFSGLGGLGSDENNRCYVTYPRNGDVEVPPRGTIFGLRGIQVLPGNGIRYKCNDGFQLDKSDFNICTGRGWMQATPDCKKLCPPISSTKTYQVTCHNSERKEVNCTKAVVGASLEYTCAPFFEVPFGYSSELFCDDGGWDKKPLCQPVCGKKVEKIAKDENANDTVNETLENPWTVAVYKKVNNSYEHICGGTILNQRIVLTAAHCLTNTDKELLPTEMFLVGTGKLHRHFDDPKDTHAQYRQVAHTEIHKEYDTGPDNWFVYDIGVIVTEEEFILNEMVQPVCFKNLKNIRLYPGYKREVIGWGHTHEKSPPDISQSFVVLTEEIRICDNVFIYRNKDYRGDKNCMLVRSFPNTCSVASGEGLVFKNPGNNRYYIQGIVSVTPWVESNCELRGRLVHTEVTAHYEFVNHLLTKYGPEDCKLPPYPENGYWITAEPNKIPGDAIPSSAMIKFQCDKGYKLTSASTEVECGSVSYIPICQKLCPALIFPSESFAQCNDKDGEPIDCLEAVDGAKLSYTCPSGYTLPEESDKIRTCTKGSWGAPKPQCIPNLKNCGETVDNYTIALISGGVEQQELLYPWIASIYYKVGDNYDHKCGGSLISERIVLTAAHCVTNDFYDVLPKEIFHVGVGKLYINYKDSRDKHAQFSDVSNVVVPDSYKGDLRRYFGDIALLVVRRPFKLTRWVKPVCFRGISSVQLREGDNFKISGWGVKDDGLVSEKLKTLDLPYKNTTVCAQELPKDWADKYNTIDKLCAGIYNQNKSVCRGDSGGGLVAVNPDNNRYYVHGIVSLGHATKGECDNSQNSLYTNVSFYYNFIDAELNNYLGICKIPQYPENGKWFVNSTQVEPEVRVPYDTILKVKCDEGYVLSSETFETECYEAASHLSLCQLSCPEVSLPKSTITVCVNQKSQEINCSKAVTDTVLFYICPEDHGSLNVTQGISNCVNGAWQPVPQCQETTIKKEEESDPSLKVICTFSNWDEITDDINEDFNATLCDYVVYPFAELSSEGKLKMSDKFLDTEANKTSLNITLTDMKEKNSNLKVLISVGETDASNSSSFSAIAADRLKRSAFIESAKDLLEGYNFDGLSIDWNIPNIEDKTNYIALLRESKDILKQQNWLLTATVHFDPENTGYDGTQMNKILDWITVKTYNMYGNSSNYTGQNSALYPSSLESEWEQTHLNLDAAAKNWIAAGVEKNKLVLSIAFYGRSFTLQDKDNHEIHAPVAGLGPGRAGVLNYSDICENYSNWTKYWDTQQKNPYLYFDDKWISYDDEKSVSVKANYIRDNGYFGVNVWPVDGDDIHGRCGPNQILLKQVHSGINTY